MQFNAAHAASTGKLPATAARHSGLCRVVGYSIGYSTASNNAACLQQQRQAMVAWLAKFAKLLMCQQHLLASSLTVELSTCVPCRPPPNACQL